MKLDTLNLIAGAKRAMTDEYAHTDAWIADAAFELARLQAKVEELADQLEWIRNRFKTSEKGPEGVTQIDINSGDAFEWLVESSNLLAIVGRARI